MTRDTGRRLTAGELLADRTGEQAAVRFQGGRAVADLTVLDLDSAAALDGGAVADLARSVAGRAGIVIGVSADPSQVRDDLLSAMTVSLVGPGCDDDRRTVTVGDLDDALASLAATVRAQPAATAVLGQLLRATADLPVVDALRLESLAYSALLAGADFRAWLAQRPDRPRRTVPADCVLVERTGEHLALVLNDPSRRNAFSAAIRDELVDALTVAVSDDTITGLTLRGAGPNFCSGGDLGEFGTGPDPVLAHIIRSDRSVGALLARFDGRSVAYLHGACVGAGVELPAFCSRVSARPNTTLRLPEIGMGLIPGAGGTASITRRIGRWRTAYLALTGTVLTAGAALAWDLVDDVTD